MHITRVQRWVLSALVLTLIFAHSTGLILAAIFTIEDDRPSAMYGLLTIAAILNVGGILGVRLINEISWKTPWVVVGVIPSVVAGTWFL